MTPQFADVSEEGLTARSLCSGHASTHPCGGVVALAMNQFQAMWAQFKELQ